MLRLTNAYPEVKSLTVSKYGDAVMKQDKELFDTFTYGLDGREIVKDGKLAWCGFTHDFVISYCVYKGYNKIGLVGVADFIEGAHFTNPWFNFNPSSVLKASSIEFIEDTYKKGIDIFTCNPNSQLEIPYISTKELLS